MTEKQYGGATGRSTGKIVSQANKIINVSKKEQSSTSAKALSDNSSSNIESNENYIKAGKIAAEVVKYAKSIIKKDVLLLEIADKIESKIIELGGKPAFPVNLSINEIAAHDTPAFNDARKASGLLKVDIGVQIEGCIADTAFSLDLENSEENKKLIMAAEKALLEACKLIKEGVTIREIGAAIEKAIKSSGFIPINNLSGHSLEPYHLHSGITVPNHDNSQEKIIESGVYAIEPFATIGLGSVRDGKLSGIYKIEREGSVRDSTAREVLAFIYEEYQTLPFCSRWIYKKFNSRGLLALRRIEESKLLHHYHQLIEVSGKKVSQAEHTIVIDKDKKTITTI
jgi:methionyl aminopeptidase